MENLKSISIYFNNVLCVGIESFIRTLVQQNRNTLNLFVLYANVEDNGLDITKYRSNSRKFISITSCNLQRLKEVWLPWNFTRYLHVVTF